MGFWSGVGSALNSPAGQGAMSGGFGLLTPSLNSRNNRRAAARSREYSERLANSAHQRQVKDMRKAGLNPILSIAQSGASTPQGGMEPSAGYENSGKDVIKDYNLAKRVKQELISASKENDIQDQELKNRQQMLYLLEEQTRKAVYDTNISSNTALSIDYQNMKDRAIGAFYNSNPSMAVAKEFGVDAGLAPKLLDSMFGKIFKPLKGK